MIRLVIPESAEEWRGVRDLVEEYAASLGVDLAFQDFNREVASLPVEYGPPRGAFLVATRDETYVGGVGLRAFSHDTAEIKRLYVRPAGRGFGVGRMLATAIIQQAQELGYRRVVLDTLPGMSEARALYMSLGFQEIAPYRFNPVEGTSFLELRLPPQSA